MTKQSIFLLLALLVFTNANAGECDDMPLTLATMREKDQFRRAGIAHAEKTLTMHRSNFSSTSNLPHGILRIPAARVTPALRY